MFGILALDIAGFSKQNVKILHNFLLHYLSVIKISWNISKYREFELIYLIYKEVPKRWWLLYD